ncbi:proline--tRNA ligase [Nitrolancea hollandica]|uniref:Proline--tRNA ligase n=1 Tax=Nitrolancea hollandica Lb TaxID=1129897 RepID=I4ECX8_9BACT|nr:proline--tRNA ligase [Nitrolancea hollandica]CCF82540.1 Prolyl-tRNA synthetase [Nitrolancea hollandica Lb]
MTDERKFVEEIPDWEDDFDRWYVEVVQKAELTDDSPVRGTKVIRPYGFALWENMQRELDRRIKDTGVENAYFPLFIPKSMLEREAEHIEGFAPEVAWVTRGGNKELEEPWAVRPTSEAIICPMYARWVQSYRDLPILINQWANVVRWEERPRAFLRSLEFLWQEGHTAHATLEEAEERARQMLGVYQDFVQTELAIPVIPGQKSESEKFAGALRTYTIEAMMGGKKWALQSATSHNLGDHFGRVFDIQFLDAQGQRQFAFNTSWGLSFRTIGAIIMVHGDSRGLKLPPRVAPIQVVIVPIRRSEAVDDAVDRVRDLLKPVARVFVDRREDKTPGYKFNEWELKGIPIRLEIGPRDVAKDQVTLVRRDTGERENVSIDNLQTAIPVILEEIQANLFTAAKRMLDENTKLVTTYDELKQRVEANAGFNLAYWCGNPQCEARVKAETHATIRCIPFQQPGEPGQCILCGNESTVVALFARAY